MAKYDELLWELRNRTGDATMCGIAGFQGRFDPSILDVMSAAMAHRGPDDAGTLMLDAGSEPVGLVHRRLSIIDLEGGRQTIANEYGAIHVVFNGEIYNYRQLRRENELLRCSSARRAKSRVEGSTAPGATWPSRIAASSPTATCRRSEMW